MDALAAIATAIAGICTAIAAWIAYKQENTPAARYEKSVAKIAELEAELERLRALGGNAACELADRLRAQIDRERAHAERLAALVPHD